MVDCNLRTRLAQDARQLVTGQITNDQFDDAYQEHYLQFDDPAVCEIATFCRSLYSDTHCYRLTGRRAVGKETKQVIARAVLFLRSGQEYGWPIMPFNPWLDIVWTYGVCPGGLIGIALLIISIMCALFLRNDTYFIATLFVVSFAILSATALMWKTISAECENNRREYERQGDYSVWPFLDSRQLSVARASFHLLGK